MKKGRILIVEDQLLIAADLCIEEKGYEVIATAQSMEDVITKCREMKPDLIL
ncbi:MAG: hypothetical protein ACLQPD_31080 [Desulfomonilaceae bacterium]